MRSVFVFIFMYLFFLITPLHAQEQPPAAVVITQVSKQKISQTQSVIGILYYDRISEVSTDVTGLVDTVFFQKGSHVQKGDILVKLDTEMLDNEISLKKTHIAQNELLLRNTKKNFKRLETLYKESGVSEKDYDDALYTFQNAKLSKQARQEELATLLIKKRRSEIRAPFDGILLTKDVDSGAWVQQGKKLVSIGSSNDLFVRAPIGESLLRYLKKGQQVSVTINAFEKDMQGMVEDIDPVADVKTKNIFVKIRIPSQDIIAANMSATVHLPAGTESELCIIPRSALIKFQGKDFVYTIKDDKAAILPVQIIAFLGEKIGVSMGPIMPGMPVIIEGNERLRPDQAIRVSGEK
ncbi:MAG: efflux RND transporter periplasmic adaptor subunit [Desulfocapsa sp.]|nr:efflux RND transporter periplasmic adaptor subunit [Desulfocapsa sp.]